MSNASNSTSSRSESIQFINDMIEKAGLEKLSWKEIDQMCLDTDGQPFKELDEIACSYIHDAFVLA